MKSICVVILATGLFLSSVFALGGKALLTTDNDFRGGALILNDLNKGQRMQIFDGHACGPSFSPDGKSISFLDVKNKKVMTCNLEGKDLKEVGDCGDYGSLGVTYWLQDGYIYFNYHNKIVYKISAKGGEREEFFKSDKEIHQFGLSNDGKRIAWTQPSYRVMVRDMETGKERTTGGDCQATMSPDGKFFTRNNGSHTAFSIHSWDDMKEVKNLKSAGGSKCNLHRWGHFSQDYVVYTKEGTHTGIIHNIETNKTTEAGKGTIWDYYGNDVVSLNYQNNNLLAADEVLIRSSLDNSILNVYLPSDDKALSEVFMMNGARISVQSLQGPGWHRMPVSSTNSSSLLVRIKNDQGVTTRRIHVR